ncbi:MAG: hypothetical protein IIC91_06410 [Chloroflexi bacterium]|nr:hypothetical protein [Chloroflexota bacterium]MCH8008482.1 hypothetical protein [Chloroflexota bacterium]
MGLEDAPLVEIESARCVECDQFLDARDFSGDDYARWPVITEASAVSQPRVHKGCGGRVELGEVRPAWHFCDENCECGLGGLPERVS